MHEKPDKILYCKFHQGHGHDIEQCQNLHYIVKRVIKDGHLRQYIITSTTCSDNREIQSMSSQECHLVILIISGGPVDDRLRSNPQEERCHMEGTHDRES